MYKVVLSVCFVKASLRIGDLNKGVVCIWEHEALSGTSEAERAVSAKVHICKVYLKDGGWLDSSQSVPAATAKYWRLGGL